jgi:hypothetical protein
VSLVGERAGVAGQRASRARVIRRTLAAIAVCGAAAGLFVCYLRLSATFAAGSDGASNALEAWDLLHGNWLLHGWTLTDVSFYTTELPEYALVELAHGLHPDVVHIAAAITYTLLVLAAAALARGRSRGGEGWARALVAAGIMLAPQLGNGVHVLLSQPDHVGTQVLLLAIFLLADRAPRRWYTVAALWALLTVAVVADEIAIVDAAAPLALVGMLHAIGSSAVGSGLRDQLLGGPSSRRSDPPRVGLVADALRDRWFGLSIAVAACSAVVAAKLILAVISRLGGFILIPVPTGIATPGRVPGHLTMTLQDTLNLFGADAGVAQPGPQTVFAWLHAPGVAVAAAAFGLALWRLPRRADLVSDALAVGLAASLASFVVSTIPSTPFDTREIAAALPFGAVLAGRMFGPWLTGVRRPFGSRSRRSPSHGGWSASGGWWSPSHGGWSASGGWWSASRGGWSASGGWWSAPGGRRSTSSGWRTWLRPGVAALVVAGGCQLASLGYEASRPAAVGPEQALAGWLAAHHLTTGLGTYTEDNITTLDSGGAVRMLTASWRPPPAGGTVARLYQSSASWYDPRTGYADFVVTGTADSVSDLIPLAEIVALAGPPARTYRFESFTIMVWNENLLTRLGTPPSKAPGDIGHS